MNQYDNPKLGLPISHIFFDPAQEKWRKQAACKNTPVNVFFPDKGASKEKVAKAKAICNKCAVKQECYNWSIQFSERALHGIWGGMTGKDRRAARKKLKFTGDDT